MTTDLHIDDFRRDTAIILLRLYNNFPRPHALYTDEICLAEETDEYGLVSKRFEACFATMIWLADEQLLRYRSMLENRGIDQANLTLKGLRLLLGISSDNQTRRVERLRRALEKHSSSALESAFDELFFDAHAAIIDRS